MHSSVPCKYRPTNIDRSTFEVLSHYHKSAFAKIPAANGGTPNLLQNLGKSRLIDLDKLLQLVEIAAEQTKPLVQSNVSGGELRGRVGANLQGVLLVEQRP